MLAPQLFAFIHFFLFLNVNTYFQVLFEYFSRPLKLSKLVYHSMTRSFSVLYEQICNASSVAQAT